ncbi:MAG: TetR/AcrR family transcriptional regulator [Planctomycetota bacterium]
MPDEARIEREFIESARRYFMRYGYSRVSTNEIAASTGRSKKTLYKHFPSKEALLQRVLEDINREIEEDVVRLMGATTDRLEQLRQLLMRVGVHVASTGDTLLLDLREKHPSLWQDSSRERESHLLGLLAGIFQQAVEDGLVRDDLAIDRILRMFLSGVQATTDASSIVAQADRPTAPFEDMATVIVEGLRRR